ncbi:alpha/beta hydrolase [Listeria costaricensis]|uniref:alpha/beta hydrolase n=1 Tax=Listeria costaricensis TaxID=2026604 RepID=UPI000C08D573|nr:alpha/beta hydrolase family protein [Listeria costaricensis]
MTVYQGMFRSQVLDLETQFSAIIPKNPRAVLYLLHGMSDDHSAWLRNSNIARYAEEHQLAVFMPSVHRSYYTDMADGLPYWTFLTQEWYEELHQEFRLSNKEFVAGLSMGGYGALKWGLNWPQRFAGIVAMSAAVDVPRMRRDWTERQAEFTRIFGTKEAFDGSGNDLFALLQQEDLPPVLQICGTEDFLYKDNLKFKQAAEENLTDFTFIARPGDHDWAFWEAAIQTALDWMDERMGEHV